MSIRNEKLHWKPEALKAGDEIKDILKPIYEKYKSIFTLEDIHYLISNESHEVILDYVFEVKE